MSDEHNCWSHWFSGTASTPQLQKLLNWQKLHLHVQALAASNLPWRSASSWAGCFFDWCNHTGAVQSKSLKKGTTWKKSDKIENWIWFSIRNLLKRPLIGTWDLKREQFGQIGFLFIHIWLLPKFLHFDRVKICLNLPLKFSVVLRQTGCCSRKSFFKRL